jgi:hypothetical protein
MAKKAASTDRPASTRPPAAKARDVSPAQSKFDSKFDPSHDAIAARAFELYLQRGAAGGSEMNDWLRAETELRTGR